MAVQYVSSQAVTGGINALTLTIPNGNAGDLCILAVSTANEEMTTPADWTLLSYQGNGTAGSAGSVRLTLFYKFESTTNAYTFSLADSGNYQYACVSRFSGVDTTTPILTYAGRNQTSATTTYTGNALTTTVDGCMIVDFIAMDRDLSSTSNLSSWANASLASITEFIDYTNTAGTGGGVGGAYGIDETAGSVDATTATISSQVYSCIAVALQPPYVAPTGQKLKYWSGSEWIEGTLKRYDGSDWVDTVLKYWNGSAWV